MAQKKTCFVIGPIGDPDTPEREHANAFLKYIAEPVLDTLDYAKPDRSDQEAKPGRITTQIIQHLLNDDLVIADLTFRNPNVYYELSLRHALGKPVVQMGCDIFPLPFDIQAERTIPFSFDVRDVERASNELAAQIRHIDNPNYKPSNVITETVTIIKIATSGDPNMASVLQAVQELAGDMRAIKREVEAVKQQPISPGSPSQIFSVDGSMSPWLGVRRHNVAPFMPATGITEPPFTIKAEMRDSGR